MWFNEKTNNYLGYQVISDQAVCETALHLASGRLFNVRRAAELLRQRNPWEGGPPRETWRKRAVEPEVVDLVSESPGDLREPATAAAPLGPPSGVPREQAAAEPRAIPKAGKSWLFVGDSSILFGNKENRGRPFRLPRFYYVKF